MPVSSFMAAICELSLNLILWRKLETSQSFYVFKNKNMGVTISLNKLKIFIYYSSVYSCSTGVKTINSNTKHTG